MNLNHLRDAIRSAFASCLDQRVFLYKQQHGFPVYSPAIAVIIQARIASEISGVAFSLNPLNNCYDEALINANFGLGESVVAGQISPDQFVVEKYSLNLLQTTTGKKQTSVWLQAEGETCEHPSPRQDELCLSGEQVRELTLLVNQVEAYYATPMDLEWAIAGGKLYLLQARPITAYVPLSPEMVTPPGTQKYLYLDMLLAKQGIHDVFSVLGLDYMNYVQRSLFRGMLGSDALFNREKGLAFNGGGRSYIHLSHSMKLQGKAKVVWGISSQDLLSVEILQHLDETEYLPPKSPKGLKKALLKAVLINLKTVKKTLHAFKQPQESKVAFKQEIEQMVRMLTELNLREKNLKTFTLESIEIYCNWVNSISLPITYAAELARSKMKKLFKAQAPQIRDKLIFLEQALPDNVTIEMGLALYDLSLFPDILNCTSAEEFVDKLQQRELTPDFEQAWEAFMERYGHRCPREMDAGVARFSEQPGEVYRQLRNLAEAADSQQNPRRIYAEGILRREKNYQELLEVMRRKRKAKKVKFEQYYNVLLSLGAYREIHKYYYIKIIAMFRQRVLQLAARLVAAGRLEEEAQIFELKLDDLEQALQEPGLNLHKCRADNLVFLRKLKGFHNFPRIIDSRGRIFRGCPRQAKAGELAGQPISPGKIRGKVKVLHYPEEKALLQGEILVARATDPGWTPLFLNAGGIVLEVGGLLQHGALVAREYCKPCVAGIENVIELLKDGQEIEVDGSAGIVRIIL